MARMRRTKCCLIILSSFVVCWFFCLQFAQAADDTLTVGLVLRDWEFLESSNKLFRLMFFSPEGSSSRYLGIQFIPCALKDKFNVGDQFMVVWVANRDKPLTDSSGNLTITHDGNLVLTGNDGIFITINPERPGMINDTLSVTLLDTGNLVLRAGKLFVWQSFDDHSSNIWLPGMKLGLFHSTMGQKQQRFLTSWLSPSIPSTGAFTFGIDPDNTKELVIWRRGVVYWRSGMWNGNDFEYFPSTTAASYLCPGELSFSYFSNGSQSYFTYSGDVNNILAPRIELHSSGDIRIFKMSWAGFWMWMEASDCDPDQVGDRSSGCVDPEPSTCTVGDTFNLTLGTMKDSYLLGNKSLVISDCKDICLKNCSCNAYASLYHDETGCEFSGGQPLGNGTRLIHIRSSTVVTEDLQRKRKLVLAVVIPVVSLIMVILICVLCYLQWRQDATRENESQMLLQFGKYVAEGYHANDIEFGRRKDHELPLLTFSCIETATEKFSAANRIGEGGFGPVYKGKLVGHEIAFKRLSRMSAQGLEEFKNEVQLISKLQHRNLVRLLGYCIEREEKILVYEYLPNKSLDSLIFDPTKQALLDWSQRVHIIEGIAQALLYLHEFSRLRIIHRDLKTSNILLDSQMNPKISDFGMARIFDENKSEVKTRKVVGTYGYMSPEYAVHGLFSTKSDVYSFGVIMLEIISGRRNTTFYESGRSSNLLGYAWELWKDGRHTESMDPTLVDSCSPSKLMLCIQVALLCVQENARDRPTMSDVVSMLSNERSDLPVPKQPAFSTHLGITAIDSTRREQRHCSGDATLSPVEAR